MRLLPRQGGSIVVTPLAQGDVWRLPVQWCYLPDPIKTLKVRLDFFLTGHGNFNLIEHTNYSAEVTNTLK
jgi:hypothetical protein